MAITKSKEKKPEPRSAAKPRSKRVTGPRKIVLDAHLKISNAQELKVLLQKFLARKQITIDASKPEKIDTSAMQLLTAFVIEAKARSIKINWQSPSPCFIKSAKLLGLEHSIQLPEEIGNK
ncbi:MAG: STAS domain-containing protein [Gammaproteobacteria bacterium]|nr:STAS domain-containing protein [Gammaproteobacteria bacterium]